MKKLISLLLCAVMVMACFAGCGSSKAAETTAATTASSVTTLTPGKLTMATSPDFAPYEFYAIGEDGTPTLSGFDIALGRYIADYLGLELEIIPMDFDGTLMELASKNVDIALSGYSPAPERMEKMDFSDIYYMSTQSFVTLKSRAGEFTSLEDTNKPGLQIGAQLGSIQMKLAEQNSPNADLVSLGKVTDVVAELVNGHLDGAYIETPVAAAYAANYPELVCVLDVPYESEGAVVGVCKGNSSLLEGINKAIAAAKADGSLDRFVAEATELASGNIQEGLLEG